MRPSQLFILLSISLVGCGKGDNIRQPTPSTKEPSTEPATPQTRNNLTMDDFRKLRPEMTLDQVYALVGQPAKDVGSGVYILQYILSDGTLIFVGSTGKNIWYVKHGDLHNGEDLLKN